MDMDVSKINEDFLLLLVERNGLLEIETFPIKKHFEKEEITINKLCSDEQDNIYKIVQYIESNIKNKLPKNSFNYCEKLDEPYQSITINIKNEIKDILKKHKKIYKKKKKAEKKNKEFDTESRIKEIKKQISKNLTLWFKVFDIETSYEQVRKINNIKVYSHRISGWNDTEYNITSDLKVKVHTNFGYGQSSYFYCVLIFKDIQIIPFSEWTDYWHSAFSQIIRYTRKFNKKTPVFYKDSFSHYKTKIKNSYWFEAIDFIQEATKLSVTNEEKFIEEYILKECEQMVRDLERYYETDKIFFLLNDEEGEPHRVDFIGSKLISFKTEKILGALDFLDKLIEYDSFFSTLKYRERILSLCTKIIPQVQNCLKEETIKLDEEKEKKRILLSENKIIKNVSSTPYKQEITAKIIDMDSGKEDLKATELFLLVRNIRMYSKNIEKIKKHIEKYEEKIKEHQLLT